MFCCDTNYLRSCSDERHCGQTTINDVVKEKVVVVADTACQGLKELCDKRQEELDKTKDEILDLQSNLQHIIPRTQT